LRPHRANQTTGRKGEDLIAEIKDTSLADLMEKIPEGEGIKDHLSS
jgi:hypothetical protein